MPAMKASTQALIALQLGLLLTVACANKVDDKPNVLPNIIGDVASGVQLPGDATSDTGLPNEATCGCLAVGQWFRFTSLELNSLDGGPHKVIPQLNGLWKTDMDNHELNFYFEVKELTKDNITFRVVNGARTDDKGATCLLNSPTKIDTTTTITMPRNGCNLLESASTGINVYAGTEVNTKNCAPNLPVKHAIPVRKAVLKARVADDCSGLVDGVVLTGSFSKAALGKVCTCLTIGPQPADVCGVPDGKYVDSPSHACDGCNDHYLGLNDLLEAYGPLNYTCVAEDGGPAVCLSATFKAERVAASPPDCK